jgi:hypothetical protein
MATRRRGRKYLLGNDTAASSMADFSPELAAVCTKWTLRTLIDLGAHEAIVQNTYCAEPGLMRALGVKSTLIVGADSILTTCADPKLTRGFC